MLSRFLESLLNWESVWGLCVRQFLHQNESDFRNIISVHLLRCKFTRDDFGRLFGGVVSLTYKTEFIFIRIHIWWWNLGRGNLTRKDTGQESLSNEAYATSVFKQMNLQAKIFSEGLAFQPQCSSEKETRNLRHSRASSWLVEHVPLQRKWPQTNERYWNKAGLIYGR